MPDSIVDAQGESINAVYGYLLFIARFLKQSQAQYIGFAFDESLSSCFRNKIYPDYKSSRGLPDENLAYQLKLCKKFTEIIGIASFSSKRYEADDLIGSLANQSRSKMHACVILTRDKDLGQLLQAKDILWDFAEQKTINRNTFVDKFGVKPEQFTDYLALVGDAIDDIPGVAGIGPKAAVFLINKYGSLENIYASINEISDLNMRGASRLQRLLVEQQSSAMISKQLASIYCDIKLNKDFSDLRWKGLDLKKFERALLRYSIKGRTKTALLNAFSKI
jgi:5'-3' exonuclease